MWQFWHKIVHGKIECIWLNSVWYQHVLNDLSQIHALTINFIQNMIFDVNNIYLDQILAESWNFVPMTGRNSSNKKNCNLYSIFHDLS
jgi:hypothetical protein